ncbi:MAG: electron transfer flavoprotein subunit alpha/FixB family protein [Flavobacteriales bacterium]|nr:electron transfer flavoprotein subunit alpha/FixB family protein [Flavobacteriales bacterium]
MSVLVFVEHDNGIVKKSGYEALAYAQDLATANNTTVTAVIINPKNADLNALGNSGANKVVAVNGSNLDHFTPGSYSHVLNTVAHEDGATFAVVSGTYNGKAVAPRLAVKMGAGLVSGVVGLPESDLSVKKTAFSNKAFAKVKLRSDKKIFCIVPNSYEVKNFGIQAEIVQKSIEDAPSPSKVTNVNKTTGKIVLTEAELVVSGGRGMKGPENWGMIEELADILGAATACSKPVSDMDWRPHSEHVGQTGITIKPNLYIAIGISGAIQHLAGVSSSKVICVINKDPEAPFFKAADYGIVGDAFEVLPKLIAKAKSLKSA